MGIVREHVVGGFGLFAVATALAGPVLGQEPGLPWAQALGVSEVRAGAYITGLELPYFMPYDDQVQFVSLDTIDGEILFNSLDTGVFAWIGAPRPHLGATISTIGRESFVHAGLTWQWDLFDSPFFAEIAFGFEINNGAISGAVRPLRNLGSNITFYQGFGLGAKLTDNVRVLAQVYHASHQYFAGETNDGLNGAGLKFGYAF